MVKIFKTGCDWIPSTMIPVRVGFIPNEANWNKFCRVYKLGDLPYLQNSSGRMTTIAPTTGTMDALCVLTLKDGLTGSSTGLAGLIAHEAVHAFDFMCEFIGEDKPSSEFKAYTIQNMVVELMHSVTMHRDEFKWLFNK